uniref:Uncharacterized protein n=1 Tax=viral metagenome TaxID=1070528 RepID=A0A6C0LIY4_9ZZZZ
MNGSFLNDDNLKLIWDLINEETALSEKSQIINQNIIQIFRDNLTKFYNEHRESDLFTMNKKYIMFMINCIKKEEQISYKKNSNDLITFKEIQNNKRVKFDDELTRHLNDFKSAIPNEPLVIPDFKIKLEDEPIKEMEKELMEIKAKRNYEIDEINSRVPKPIIQKPSIQTSFVQPPFVQPPFVQKPAIEDSSNNKKYIKILDESPTNNVLNVINLGMDEESSYDDANIFNKLKRTSAPDVSMSNIAFELKRMNERIDNLYKIIEIKNEIKQ